MSKTLYEEALAEARQIKEVAEANAKRAILDTVTPRIKELIEKQLLGESTLLEEEEELDEMMASAAPAAVGVTHPGTETSEPVAEEPVEETYELTAESTQKLASLSEDLLAETNEKFENAVYRLVETTNRLVASGPKVRQSVEFSRKIIETIQKVEDMYSCLRETNDFARKTELENRLESCFEVLSAVKETTMRMKDLLSKENIMEDLEQDPTLPAAGEEPVDGGKELTMKITGLPDDVELDKLNIDLISDEEDPMGEPSMDAAPEMDLGAAPTDMPAEGDVFESDEVEDLDELDEDDVVEISEAMLEQELARLTGKSLQEMDADVLDDFGGGKDEGEPFLDGEVSTADKDNMVNQADKKVGTTDKVACAERKGVAAAKAALAERKAQAAKKSVKGASSNDSSKQLAEATAANELLRKQLTEVNLLNAKLLQANKLLQLEGLTVRQKSVIIDKLDEAQNLREVKLVYESLVKALTDSKKKPVTESTARGVLAGSSSRTTRSATSKVDEGYETARWAELAGLRKK